MQSESKAAGVSSIWRYPVKSMLGEEITNSLVTPRGLLGDRTYALVDQASGKVVSAKNPRKWPNMFAFAAAYTAPLRIHDEGLPPVLITMPDGRSIATSYKELDALLSALGCRVSLESNPPSAPKLEEYWPDLDNLAHRETVTDEAMPDGTFFDGAVIHLLTTTTLDKLHGVYPSGSFRASRFRPNLIVAPENGDEGFVEKFVGRLHASHRRASASQGHLR